MKRITLIMLTGLFLLTASFRAEAAGGNTNPRHALGFSAGFTSGYGLSYKYFYSPGKAVQLTGIVAGQSDNYLDLNLGAMAQFYLVQKTSTSLILGLGGGWHQYTDYMDNGIYPTIYSPGDTNYIRQDQSYDRAILGLLVGIEFKMFENIGLGFFGGYRYVYERSYENVTFATYAAAENSTMKSSWRLGPTGDISLFYYF